jgi:hypothetical protein
VALVLARPKTFRPSTRVVALAFVGEAAMLLAALFFGPPRVREFAFGGTLVNRLLLQLAPPAGVLLTLALSDAAVAWQAVRRPTVRALGLAPQPAQVPVLSRSNDSR